MFKRRNKKPILGLRYRKKKPFNNRKNFRKIHTKRFERPSKAVVRQPSGLPDRLFVKLNYVELLTFDPAGGILSVNVYRGNDCYDPDFTGGGGQPYFFNQWNAFYNNFFVHGSKLSGKFMCGGNTNNNLVCGITPSNVSTSFGGGGQELIMEQPYSRYRSARMGTTGVGQTFVKNYMTTRKLVGLDKSTSKGLQYSGTGSASPANQWYWHLWIYVPDGNTPNVQCIVKQTVYVEFFNRLRPALS